MLKQGLIQIYTGDGKGKTTAAAGLAARALSRRLRVCWVSFFKGTVPDLPLRRKSEGRIGTVPCFVGETALLRKWGADVFRFVPEKGDCPNPCSSDKTGTEHRDLRVRTESMTLRSGLSHSCSSPFRKGGLRSDVSSDSDETSEGILQKKVRQECLKALGLISEIFKKNYDVIILDEINIALRNGFLKEAEILLLLRHKPKSTEVVLTGRGATPGLIKAASLVTEMKKIKHPFDKGTKARPGIEY